MQTLLPHISTKRKRTYVFNVRARVDSDQITVLDTEVMSDNTVDANAAVIELVIGQHDQDGILPHLTLHQNRITPEKLQGIHSVVGESDNGVIIVSGIGDTVREEVLGQPHAITNKVPCGIHQPGFCELTSTS